MSDVEQHPFWQLVRGEVPPPPCAQTLGWTVIEAEPGSGRFVADFEAKQEFTNPLGNVQGGFLAAMLDDTMGPAVGTLFGPDEFCTSLEMKVNFLRPAKPGRLRVTAWVVHRGKSTAFVQAELRDGAEDLICTSTATMRLIRPSADQYWAGGDR